MDISLDICTYNIDIQIGKYRKMGMKRESISWFLFVWRALTNINKCAPIPLLLHRPVLTKMAFIGAYKVPGSIFVLDIGFLNEVKTALPIINKETDSESFSNFIRDIQIKTWI